MSDTFFTALESTGGTLAFGRLVWQGHLTPTSVKVSQLMTADAIRSRLDAQAADATLPLSAPPWEPVAWTNLGMPCNT